MPISRHEAWVQVAELDDRDPERLLEELISIHDFRGTGRSYVP